MSDLILESAKIILAYAIIWFLISIIIRRNDIVDIAWGLGYIVLVIYYLVSQEPSARAIILYSMIFIWGMRLAIHILIRNKGKKEDLRYLNWRNQWGKFSYIRSFFQVFILQGLLLLIIISPVTIVSANPQPALGVFDLAGVIIWIIGFYFEAVGDYQLFKFKKNSSNKGEIITIGLWKYSRHPNYFGEVTMWWGIFVVALPSPYGIYALISPILITLLMLFVSGVPMLEKRYINNPDYQIYMGKTSRFIPLPQRKK